MQSSPDYKKLQKKLTTKKMSDALVMQAASRILHHNTLDRLKQIANEEIKEPTEKVMENEIMPEENLLKKLENK